MFDIAPSEFLLTAIVAIVVIGPKDMPLALRTAGKWIGKMRRMSNHLRSGFETMIREAELEEMERKWREQNQAIMAAHPNPDPVALPHEPAFDAAAMLPLAAPAATIEQPDVARAAAGPSDAPEIGASPAHEPAAARQPVAAEPPLS